MRTTLVVLVLLAAFVAPVPAGPPPTRTRPLLRWLGAGRYRASYVGQPAPTDSASVHGLRVRTWYSPPLAADLAAGRVPFRAGAAMVKELYEPGTEHVIGWSVMRKVRRRSARGRGWFFFETADGRSVFAHGRGEPVCVGCHASGMDFLLSPFRP